MPRLGYELTIHDGDNNIVSACIIAVLELRRRSSRGLPSRCFYHKTVHLFINITFFFSRFCGAYSVLIYVNYNIPVFVFILAHTAVETGKARKTQKNREFTFYYHKFIELGTIFTRGTAHNFWCCGMGRKKKNYRSTNVSSLFLRLSFRTNTYTRVCVLYIYWYLHVLRTCVRLCKYILRCIISCYTGCAPDSRGAHTSTKRPDTPYTSQGPEYVSLFEV